MKQPYNPIVSIIVPIYNAEPYIDTCLNSICNQTYQELEIICVINNSTDKSETIVQKYESTDKRIRIIHEEKQGLSCARNCGLECARGEYILFVDSDDYIEYKLVETTISRALSTNADIILFGYISLFNNGCQAKKERRHIRQETVNPILIIPDLYSYTNPAVWSKLYRKQFLDEKKIRFDPRIRFVEDVLFTWLSFLHADSISSVDEYLYFYRVSNPKSNTVRRANGEGLLEIFDVYDQVLASVENSDNKEKYQQAIKNRLLIEIDNAFNVASNYEHLATLWNSFNEKWKPLLIDISPSNIALYNDYVNSNSLSELLAKLYLRKKRSLDNAINQGRINNQQLLEQLAKSTEKNTELNNRMNELLQSLNDMQLAIDKKNNAIRKIKQSTTWQAGLVILFIPKKITKLLSCLIRKRK